jgi:hypothetical protein
VNVKWLFAVFSAAVVTAATAALLWVFKAPPVEIVKTAGVAGGAVVALYALWLNDRKHLLESDKVADERFARSVELLGNEADQVRVGAMHSLVWLANSTPRYKQTVLDVLCAYLRRPFHHPSWEENGADPDTIFAKAKPEDQQEQQVRRTAQRLIRDLLSWGKKKDRTHYDLDLTGAALEYFQLDGRRVNRFVARRAQFYGITEFRKLHVKSRTFFSGATFHGRLSVPEAKFEGGLAFTEAIFKRKVDFRAATVGTFLALTDPPPPEQIGQLTLLPGTELRIRNDGWALTGDVQPPRPRFEDEVEESTRGGADGLRGDHDGLGNGRVPAKADEVRAVGLEGEGLGDESDSETEPDEVKK